MTTLTTSLECVTQCIDVGKVFCPNLDFTGGKCFTQQEYNSGIVDSTLELKYCTQTQSPLPYFSCPRNDKCSWRYSAPDRKMTGTLFQPDYPFLLKDETCSFEILFPIDSIYGD